MSSKNVVPVTAKKSLKQRHVALDIQLICSGWPGPRARISGGADLSTDQARALAGALIEFADQSDARADAQTAAEARRRTWRDREIAAGRMIVFGRL